MSTETAAKIALPAHLGRALFRTHIENGIWVGLSTAFVGVTVGLLFGRYPAVLACSGALSASVIDTPGALKIKALLFGLVVTCATLLNAVTLITVHTPLIMASVIAAVSFSIGLISAYGRRGIALGVGMVLALLCGMMVPLKGPLWQHMLTFGGGGVLYATFSLAVGALLEDRNRRLLLAESLRAFSGYLAAKSAIYDPGVPVYPALQKLMEAHSSLIEQLQSTRDIVFVGARRKRQMRWMATMITLLDAFHTVLSSDADIEILRQSIQPRLMHRLRILAAGIADDAQKLALTLVAPGESATISDHEAEFQLLYDEIGLLANTTDSDNEPVATAALRSTVHKLERAVFYMKRLAMAITAATDAATIIPQVDLTAFISRDTISPRRLLTQWHLSSPVMRYAIRFTLAMTCAYGMTLWVSTVAHAGWVLLTTALILRASYSVTKKRRNDRIIGTVIGCLVAAFLVHIIPKDWLFLPTFVTVGTAHAFAPVYFVATSVSASVTALLQLYFLAPEGSFVFVERIIDTLIGAAIAWLFSYLLPSWEWRNVPKLVRRMVDADRRFVLQAVRLKRNDQQYRLARKRAHDTFANLSATVRRLADEPKMDRRAFVALNDLLIANYMLASEIASMRVLFRMRKDELTDHAETLLERARSNVDATLGAFVGTAEPHGHLSHKKLGAYLGGTNAMISLRRRLIHLDRAAQRVAARASRALSEIQKNT